MKNGNETVRIGLYAPFIFWFMVVGILLSVGIRNSIRPTTNTETATESVISEEQALEIFNETKELLRTTLSQYQSLYWTRFDETTLCFEHKSGKHENGSKSLGHYVVDENAVKLYNEALIVSTKELRSILAHELGHALTVGRGEILLYEGVAELIAFKATGSTEGDSYVLPYRLIIMFETRYGLEETLFYIREGFIGALFDNDIEPGAYKRLESAAEKFINNECSDQEFAEAEELLEKYAAVLEKTE